VYPPRECGCNCVRGVYLKDWVFDWVYPLGRDPYEPDELKHGVQHITCSLANHLKEQNCQNLEKKKN
jgi:hypothetical protein